MSRPAVCHPERPRKLADGTCDRCYARGRYWQDEALREATKAASRRHWRKTKRALTDEQKAARRERVRGQYAADPRRFQSQVLKSKFGITLDDYDAMLVAQGGGCQICGAPPAGDKRLAVDHCHETGRVRGLLCTPCNQALGLMRDDPNRLQRAIAYLSADAEFMETHPEYGNRP